MTTKEDLNFLLDAMKDWDIINRKTVDVYNDYTAVCRKADRKPIERRDFSKQVCSIFNFRTKNTYVAADKCASNCFCR